MLQHKQVGNLSFLLYFAISPIVFAVFLRPYAPSKVPMHMDLWGNVDKWAGKESFLTPFVLMSMVLFILVWAAVIAKYRGQGSMVYLFLGPVILLLYYVALALLMGMVNGRPDTTNIYIGIGWNIDRIFVALMTVTQTLVGTYLFRQQSTNQTRLAWLLGGGINYLILAVPSLSHKALLSCLATVLLLAYTWYKLSGHKWKPEHRV